MNTLTTEKNRRTKNIRVVFVLFVLMTIAFFFSFATSSHAITITGSETITTNSSASYSVGGCDGSVSWSVTGTGASISSNGVLTTGSASCGGITVTARCSDGSIATKTVRVTNAGGWILLRYAVCTEGTNAYTACPVETDYSSEIQGKYKMAYWTHTSKSLHWNADGTTPVLGEGCFILQQLGFTKNNNWGIGTNERAIGYGTCPGVIIQNSYKSLNAYIWEWQCPSCTSGQTISCYSGPAETKNKGECKAGTQTCVNRQWGACQGEVTPVEEICGDGKDNNCNNQTDEGCCEVGVKVSPTEVAPQKTSRNTKAEVEARLLKPSPPEGCTVVFGVETVEGSGGHNHIGGRPTGSLSKNTVTLIGDVAAKTVIYESGEVAGTENIVAVLLDPMGRGIFMEELPINVKVPILGILGSGSEWRLTGSTGQHPSNHYGEAYTIDAMLKIAKNYFDTTKTTLGINDMSLAWGGLFDISGKWRSPHSLHRKGTSVDIDRWVYKVSTKELVLINCEDDDKLSKIVKNNFGYLLCEPGGLKHIEFTIRDLGGK